MVGDRIPIWWEWPPAADRVQALLALPTHLAGDRGWRKPAHAPQRGRERHRVTRSPTAESLVP
jgi:hypothetical protein